jgi:hypothetical protein
MVLVNKGTKARKKLACTRAKTGAGCKYVSVDYRQVEEALLDQIYWLLADCPAQSEEEDVIRAELQDIEAAVAGAGDIIENLVTAIEKGDGSPALTARLKETEDALEELKQAESALWSKLELIARTMIDRKVALLQEAVEQQPLDRERVNAGLRGLFSQVVIDYPRAELVFHWRHGGASELVYDMWAEGRLDGQPRKRVVGE